MLVLCIVLLCPRIAVVVSCILCAFLGRGAIAVLKHVACCTLVLACHPCGLYEYSYVATSALSYDQRMGIVCLVDEVAGSSISLVYLGSGH